MSGPVTSKELAPATPLPASTSASGALSELKVGRSIRSARVLLPLVSYRLGKLGGAGAAGTAVLLAAIGAAALMLLPLYNRVASLDVQLHHPPPPVPIASAAPPHGLAQLLQSLPTRSEVPGVLAQIYQQAAQASVELDVGHYTFVPAKTGTAARYEIELPVKAPYPNIRDFIDRTLAGVPAVGLEKLRVERKAVADTVVTANIRFVLFLRSEGAAP